MNDRRRSARHGGREPRWWWFFIISAWAWNRVASVIDDLFSGRPVHRFDVAASPFVVLAVPVFEWARRRESRQRQATAANR